MTTDPSYGYNAIAEQYISARSPSGLAIIEQWASGLAPESRLIDIGAGFGEPVTPVLIKAKLEVWAIDAAPRMVAEFRKRFPDIEIACETAEESPFFNQSYDAALAIGLIFLLPEAKQSALIRRVSERLKPGGRFLFSAPLQAGAWQDVLTKQTSYSLGQEAYERLLRENGFSLLSHHSDVGGTNYYDVVRAED